MFGLRGLRVVAGVALGAATLAGPVAAHAQTTTSTAPVGPPPKAFVVVDQATGDVLAGSNEHTPLPPASLTKILTALVAVGALGPNATVPVSARAAGMPAHKLNMQPGSVWPIGNVLAALLASSANDAAAALAERVSGSMENFSAALDKLARHLQMADNPTLRDPAGLDDQFSVDGGNLISARDLAIAARAVLDEPRLAPIVAAPITQFVGPDGIHHRLVNHNKLLTRYPGAIGMKTGYTRKAGRDLIAAATRNGRTEIAVVLNVSDTYGWAERLLDQTFAEPLPSAADRLPAIASRLELTPVGTAAAAVSDLTPAKPAAAKRSAARRGGVAAATGEAVVVAIALVVALWCTLRARVVVRRHRRRRRRATAQVKRGVHRRRHPELTPHYRPQEELKDRFHSATRR